ncbi:glyoxylate reductase [Balneicella halophila]|uniref:Glyoxylate reductase n=1 Tax=Balneicella halophila TaxID=1537566 RepID=A0A7L4UQ60_BALHA|nr:NAD(P)-dependent oxidoreductase [Balneicella halophila]PVX51906.1 glyoxylate reductase [Balneicella halophila]
MKKVLVTYDIPKKGLAILEEKGFQVDFPEKTYFTKEELIEKLPEYDALLAVFVREVDKEIIQAGKNLKIISNYGVGFNNIDIKVARDKDIAVTNTPVSVCEPTAELAFGLLLATMRNISGVNLGLRHDPDFKWGIMENLGNTLVGKRLGIIGMGNIGQAIARRALAFGMEVVYHNRNQLKKSIEDKYEAKYVSLKELLKTSDAVSLNVPLTDETHHLIDEKALKMMKESAFLVNTARGPVVDESALIEALERGRIAGAGLDVFEEEPHIPEALLDLPNVTLTPHTGSATFEDRILTGKEAAENIIAFFEGKPQNVVN